MTIDRRLLLLICLGLLLLLANFLSWRRLNKYSLAKTKIYFLHLEKYEDRRQRIQELIQKFGLKNVVIFPGVDGAKLDKNQYRHLMTKRSSRQLTRGQVGCLLGHFKIWEEIASSGKDGEYYLIFEDDVYVDDEIDDKFKKFMSELPEDFEFGQLWHSDSKKYTSSRRQKKYQLAEKKYVQKGYPQTGLVGCLMTKKGAQKLLQLCHPITTTVDTMIVRHLKKGKIKSYIPKDDLIYLPPEGVRLKSIVRNTF